MEMRDKKSKEDFKKSQARRKYITITFLIIFCIGGGICAAASIHMKKQDDRVMYMDILGKGDISIKSLRDKRLNYEQSLNIKEVNYNWKEEFIESNTPVEIVYHHTGSSKSTPEQINEMHKNEGWNGIGYYFYIRKDGEIYRGRPEEVIGSHVYGRNRDTIGICLEGNFEVENPTESQIQSLVKLSTDMVIKYDIKNIEGHRDLNQTLCPGKNLDIEGIKQKVAENIIYLAQE